MLFSIIMRISQFINYSNKNPIVASIIPILLCIFTYLSKVEARKYLNISYYILNGFLMFRRFILYWKNIYKSQVCSNSFNIFHPNNTINFNLFSPHIASQIYIDSVWIYISKGSSSIKT